METVQKAVRDAAVGLQNLAFGEQKATEPATQHGEEPVSGVQGRGTPTDPYDAGNRDGELSSSSEYCPCMTTCCRSRLSGIVIIVCDGYG
jgi:hypothetical protein